MALRHSRHRLRPGIAELGVAVAALLPVVFAVLWARSSGEAQWPRTPGTVVRSSVRLTHYNAEEYSQKVELAYRYHVDGVAFQDTWEGFWPMAGSPNALAPEQLEDALCPGSPLVVLYSPHAPHQSRLHYGFHAEEVVYGALFAVSLAGALFYVARVYPRRRMRA